MRDSFKPKVRLKKSSYRSSRATHSRLSTPQKGVNGFGKCAICHRDI